MKNLKSVTLNLILDHAAYVRNCDGCVFFHRSYLWCGLPVYGNGHDLDCGMTGRWQIVATKDAPEDEDVRYV